MHLWEFLPRKVDNTVRYKVNKLTVVYSARESSLIKKYLSWYLKDNSQAKRRGIGGEVQTKEIAWANSLWWKRVFHPVKLLKVNQCCWSKQSENKVVQNKIGVGGKVRSLGALKISIVWILDSTKTYRKR